MAKIREAEAFDPVEYVNMVISKTKEPEPIRRNAKFFQNVDQNQNK